MHVDPRPVGPEGWWCWLLLTSPSTHQKNVHKLIMPSLNNYFKTFHYLLQVGTPGFEGISPLWPPSPGKVKKLSFFTSPITQSLKLDSVLVYREAELSASELKNISRNTLFLPLIFCPTIHDSPNPYQCCLILKHNVKTVFLRGRKRITNKYCQQ